MKPDTADLIDDYRHDFLGAMSALTIGFAMQLETFVGLRPNDAAAMVTEWLTDSAEAHQGKLLDVMGKASEGATKN